MKLSNEFLSGYYLGSNQPDKYLQNYNFITNSGTVLYPVSISLPNAEDLEFYMYWLNDIVKEHRLYLNDDRVDESGLIWNKYFYNEPVRFIPKNTPEYELQTYSYTNPLFWKNIRENTDIIAPLQCLQNTALISDSGCDNIYLLGYIPSHLNEMYYWSSGVAISGLKGLESAYATYLLSSGIYLDFGLAIIQSNPVSVQINQFIFTDYAASPVAAFYQSGLFRNGFQQIFDPFNSGIYLIYDTDQFKNQVLSIYPSGTSYQNKNTRYNWGNKQFIVDIPYRSYYDQHKINQQQFNSLQNFTSKIGTFWNPEEYNTYPRYIIISGISGLHVGGIVSANNSDLNRVILPGATITTQDLYLINNLEQSGKVYPNQNDVLDRPNYKSYDNIVVSSGNFGEYNYSINSSKHSPDDLTIGQSEKWIERISGSLTYNITRKEDVGDSGLLIEWTPTLEYISNVEYYRNECIPITIIPLNINSLVLFSGDYYCNQGQTYNNQVYKELEDLVMLSGQWDTGGSNEYNLKKSGILDLINQSNNIYISGNTISYSEFLPSVNYSIENIYGFKSGDIGELRIKLANSSDTILPYTFTNTNSGNFLVNYPQFSYQQLLYSYPYLTSGNIWNSGILTVNLYKLISISSPFEFLGNPIYLSGYNRIFTFKSGENDDFWFTNANVRYYSPNNFLPFIANEEPQLAYCPEWISGTQLFNNMTYYNEYIQSNWLFINLSNNPGSAKYNFSNPSITFNDSFVSWPSLDPIPISSLDIGSAVKQITPFDNITREVGLISFDIPLLVSGITYFIKYNNDGEFARVRYSENLYTMTPVSQPQPSGTLLTYQEDLKYYRYIYLSDNEYKLLRYKKISGSRSTGPGLFGYGTQSFTEYQDLELVGPTIPYNDYWGSGYSFLSYGIIDNTRVILPYAPYTNNFLEYVENICSFDSGNLYNLYNDIFNQNYHTPSGLKFVYGYCSTSGSFKEDLINDINNEEYNILGYIEPNFYSFYSGIIRNNNYTYPWISSGIYGREIFDQMMFSSGQFDISFLAEQPCQSGKDMLYFALLPKDNIFNNNISGVSVYFPDYTTRVHFHSVLQNNPTDDTSFYLGYLDRVIKGTRYFLPSYYIQHGNGNHYYRNNYEGFFENKFYSSDLDLYNDIVYVSGLLASGIPSSELIYTYNDGRMTNSYLSGLLLSHQNYLKSYNKKTFLNSPYPILENNTDDILSNNKFFDIVRNTSGGSSNWLPSLTVDPLIKDPNVLNKDIYF